MPMTPAGTTRVYDVWSRTYDWCFGAMFHAGHVRAVDQLHLKPGDRVLDIGVGTGIMLGYYPRDVSVVGMDLSRGMLERASDRIRKDNLDHCHLVQGDALNPPFADQSFDHIMLSHVVTVVSDQAALFEWTRRLLKPNGTVVIINHFRSENPIIGWWAKLFNPLCMRCGWRSDLSLEDVLKLTDLRMEYRFRSRRFGMWQVVVLVPPEARPTASTVPAIADATPAPRDAGEAPAGLEPVTS